MTAKRQPDCDEFEIKFGKGTYSWRVILIALIASATPMGQQVLKNFGIQTPAAQDTSETQKAVETIKSSVSAMEKEFASVRAEVTASRAEVSTMKADVNRVATAQESLSSRVSGFQIDFEKYRATLPPTNK